MMMIWVAKVYDRDNGQFLARVTVKSEWMRDAEKAAISKTALAMRGDPKRMDVRSMAGFKESKLTR